ncbi:hypothetical protein ACLMJK_003655 [Lecanora helva]
MKLALSVLLWSHIALAISSARHHDGNTSASPQDPAPQTNLTLTAGTDVPEYTVFPVKPAKVREVLQKIKLYAEGGLVETQRSLNYPEFGGVLYWRFRATESNARMLKQALGLDATLVDTKPAAKQGDTSIPGSETASNTTNGNIPLNDLNTQSDAPQDLKVVSWPPSPPQKLDSLKYYLYNNDFAFAPMLYIIDTGLDFTNLDFNYGTFVKRWRYSRDVRRRGRATKGDDNPNSHGSCVASKAMGLINGVYKSSKLVVVKINPALPIDELVSGFDEVLLDIRDNADSMPPVVMFSLYSTESYPDFALWYPLKRSMQKIFDIGGTIVTLSGNDAEEPGRGRPVDTLPALWADDSFPLIVAGSVDNSGRTASFSQGPNHVTTWAPGVEIQCAARRSTRRLDSGTSFSVGMVAGLAAYALARDQVPYVTDARTPYGVRDWLLRRARWTRPQGQYPVIWNREQGY